MTRSATHPQRVAALARRLGAALGLDEASLAALELGARLHDIGKVGVPAALLGKPSTLTPSEHAVVHRHVIVGDSLAREFQTPELVRLVIRYHHEQWNGRGYPDGLKGTAIPLVARIIAVVDAYAAMRESRLYRPVPLSVEQARTEVARGAGTQFDPALTHVFLSMSEPLARGSLPTAGGSAYHHVRRRMASG